MNRWITTEHGCEIVRVLAGRSNVFLVSWHGSRILVDTGPPSERRALDAALRGLGVSRLEALVLTHAHYDHAGNALHIRQEYGARVIVHTSEDEFLRSGRNIGEGIVPRGTNWFTNFMGNVLVPLWVPRVEFEPCVADVLAGDRMDLGQFGLNAFLLHTPGHSIGSMTLVVDDEIALCGDTLFGVFPGSATPPWAWDHAMMVRSWGRLLETPCRLFLPSHGSQRLRDIVARQYAHHRPA